MEHLLFWGSGDRVIPVVIKNLGDLCPWSSENQKQTEYYKYCNSFAPNEFLIEWK